MMQRNQRDHNNFLIWPLANPNLNDKFKYIQMTLLSNVNFRLNTFCKELSLVPFFKKIFIYGDTRQNWAIQFTFNKRVFFVFIILLYFFK